MAGLLDSILGSYGGGGLLSGLTYPSPLLQPQEQPPQMIYSPDGMPIFTPQSDKPSPFGLPPNFNPADYAPQSPFTAGATPAPFAAPPSFAPGPTIAPSPQAAPQPAPQSSLPPVDFPQNQIGVGGYQMPRVGDASNFVPDQVNTPPNAQPAQGFTQPGFPQPQALPPALGNQGGFGAGLRGFAENLHTGPLGALVGGIGGALGAQSPSQQNAKAQFDALVPLVGPQKAMLAVLNPEAGKTILAQALEKKNYGFTKLDNDTVLRTDPLTGKAEVAYGGAAPTEIQGPDGKLIQMPAGADPKTWRNEITRINADVAAGKKTEVQAKAEIFGNKMELANKSITDDVGTSLSGKIASGLPLGNYAQSPEYQKYKQASSNFITALLRQESGAAINKSEFERYDREYMPQPGDSKEVLAQKAEARRIAIEGMKKGAGPGYKSPTSSNLPSGWSVSVR